MRLKVLPAESWMLDEEELEDCIRFSKYIPVSAAYNRPGIYLYGNNCWFEVGGGKAYTFPKSYFTYNLDILNAKRLNERQFKALKEIHREGLATKSQIKLMYDYRAMLTIRNSYRMARKHRLAGLQLKIPGLV